MADFVQLMLDFATDLGYPGIIILMAIESSFIPFPSEVVIPPAAYLAFKGQFNVFLVTLCGVIGSLIGAVVNYVLAMYLGRPLVYVLVEKKWAKFFLLSKKNVEKAESYFLKYGAMSTFLGRLVPAVRQLISLPAGFVRMNFLIFLFFTFLGSTIWVSILAALGYFFGSNQEIFQKYYETIAVFTVLFVILFVGIYLFYKFRRKDS